MDSVELKGFFDDQSNNRDYWIQKNGYYNDKMMEFLRFHVPKGSSVLEIGCATGHLLNALKPTHGVGVDFSEKMVRIAQKKYPHLRFVVSDAADYQVSGKFDYIIISDTAGFFEDIQTVFRHIRGNCTHRTRIIITTYNHVWEPVLYVCERLGLKMRSPFINWLSCQDMQNLLYLEKYDVISSGRRMLLPKRIPLISNLANQFLSNLPLIDRLCLINYIITRPTDLGDRKELSVSVVVAARNEEGNIEAVVKNMPNLGRKTETIFVEGGSSDNTWEEIMRVAKKYPKKNVRYAKQDGRGKGDAVRKGFELAKGEVLMIYDADMTVAHCELVKFYEAIADNRGEFINGSRLVYPLERGAMRTLNLFGNTVFSMFFSWILKQRIKDTLCGTKVILKKDYEKLKASRSYFGEFDPFGDFDLLFGAAKLDLKIIEIPIRYMSRTYGETNISRFRHGLLLAKMCLFSLPKIKFI